MHILSLLWRGCQPCTDGPYRLISNHRTGEDINTERFDDAVQLTPDNLKRFTRFALFEGFPYTEHRLQTTSLCRSELAIEDFVVLANDLAALRVPNQYQPATCINQLTRSNFTSQRALCRLYRRILSANGDRLTL
ncbi:hypothetical protein D3C81_715300 [compost metagenome]